MATYDASSKRLCPLRRIFTDDDHCSEHCSADLEKLAMVGRAPKHQVRIKRNGSEYGLYTVSGVRPESPGNIVRMGPTGRKRLGTSGEYRASWPTCGGARAGGIGIGRGPPLITGTSPRLRFTRQVSPA